VGLGSNWERIERLGVTLELLQQLLVRSNWERIEREDGLRVPVDLLDDAATGKELKVSLSAPLHAKAFCMAATGKELKAHQRRRHLHEEGVQQQLGKN
jgi:hypothetical protein